MSYTLHCGDYRERMTMVRGNALITDPPYSAKVHSGTDDGVTLTADGSDRRVVAYKPWTEDDLDAFVRFWHTRITGWMCIFTSSDLVPSLQASMRSVGRYVFHPIPIVVRGMTVRMQGDGPSSWAYYMVPSRPVGLKWRTLRGYYDAPSERGAPIVGAKPVSMVRDMVRDYSDPGDTIIDPCAGWGSTILAAGQTGRSAIGCEIDVRTHALALERIQSREELFT